MKKFLLLLSFCLSSFFSQAQISNIDQVFNESNLYSYFNGDQYDLTWEIYPDVLRSYYHSDLGLLFDTLTLVMDTPGEYVLELSYTDIYGNPYTDYIDATYETSDDPYSAYNYWFQYLNITESEISFSFPNIPTTSKDPVMSINILKQGDPSFYPIRILCGAIIPTVKNITINDDYKQRGDTIILCDVHNAELYDRELFYINLEYEHSNDYPELSPLDPFSYPIYELWRSNVSVYENAQNYSSTINDNNSALFSYLNGFDSVRFDWYPDRYTTLHEILLFDYNEIKMWMNPFEEISSKTYFVKEEVNPRVIDVLVSQNDTVICPGDVVTLKKNTANATSWYLFKEDNYERTIDHYSNKDSLVISRPISLYLADNTAGSECADISKVTHIVSGNDCNRGMVQGYVKQKFYNNATNQYDPIAGVLVSADNGQVQVSDSLGYFQFLFEESDMISEISVSNEDYFFDIESVEYLNDFLISSNEILYTYLLETDDLAVFLSSGRNRPGFTIPYYITVENRSGNVQTSDVSILLNEGLTYKVTEGEDSPSLVNMQTLTWSNVSVASGEKVVLKFFAELDRTTLLGTELQSIASLGLTDDVANNNIDTLVSEVTGSYDPNDKLVSFNGFASQGFVHDTTEFEYTVRFQNTGIDTAFTVRVQDVIDTDFDLSSIHVIDASHNYRMTIDNDTVNWIFENILLVDSLTNEPASHGFVRFRIKQNPNNPDGTMLTNQAAIFFDFNDPIITNKVVNEVGEPSIVLTSLSVENTEKVLAYPNPTDSEISFTRLGELRVYNSLGQLQYSGATTNLQVGLWQEGIYYFDLLSGGETYRGSFVKQ